MFILESSFQAPSVLMIVVTHGYQVQATGHRSCYSSLAHNGLLDLGWIYVSSEKYIQECSFFSAPDIHFQPVQAPPHVRLNINKRFPGEALREQNFHHPAGHKADFRRYSLTRLVGIKRTRPDVLDPHLFCPPIQRRLAGFGREALPGVFFGDGVAQVWIRERLAVKEAGHSDQGVGGAEIHKVEWVSGR